MKGPDGHVRFRSKYYSVDEQMIGQDVVVIGNRETVWIYHGGKLIETHERLTDSYRSKSTKPHHLKPWERAMGDTSVYRDRARAIGPYVDEMVVRIIGHGLGVIDFRKVWGILSLDKSYPATDIDEACRQALMMGSHSFRTIQRLLTILPKTKSLAPTDTAIPHEAVDSSVRERVNRFTRSMKEYGAVVASVTKH